MEIDGRKREEESNVCAVCEDNIVCGYCEKCDEWMCQDCFDNHNKYKLSRDHVLSSAEPVENNNERNDNTRCETHDNDIIKYYCKEHEQACCGHCVYLHHKKCDYVLLEDINKASLDEIEALCETIDNNVACIDKRIESIRRNEEIANEDLDQFHAKIISYADASRTELAIQAQEKCTEEQARVTELKEKNEKIRSELKEIIAAVDVAGDNPLLRLTKFVEARPEVENCKVSLEDLRSAINVTSFKFTPSRLIKRLVTASHTIGKMDDGISVNEIADDYGEEYKELQDKYKATANRLDVIFGCDITHDRLKTLPCGHDTCGTCYEKKPVCVCFKCYIIYGNQPEGTRDIEEYYYRGTNYKITYTFYDGIQSLKHPHPGQCYSGTVVQTRLVKNSNGEQIRRLLDIAFERKVLFTVNNSGDVVSNGVDMFTRGRKWDEYDEYVSRVWVQLALLVGAWSE